MLAVVAVVEVIGLVTLVAMAALVALVAMVLVCWGGSSGGSGSIVVGFFSGCFGRSAVVCSCSGSVFTKATSSCKKMSCFRSNHVL